MLYMSPACQGGTRIGNADHSDNVAPRLVGASDTSAPLHVVIASPKRGQSFDLIQSNP